MCDPATLGVATFAIGAGQAITGYMGQQQAADRQNDYAARNRFAAITALGNSYAAANNQIVQESGAAGHQLFENEIKGAQARGTALTAAGQAGVDGSASTAAVMQDYFSREGRGSDAVISNYNMTRDNIAANELSAMGTATSRINSVQQAAPPNFFDAGLRIAGAAASGAGTYYRDTNLQRGWANPYGSSGSTQSAESYTG